MEETKFDILNEFEHNIMLIQEGFETSGSTDNLQITELCRYLFGSDFIGVYTSDQFPKNVKNNNMFIMNTQPSTQPGLHWVAFVKEGGIELCIWTLFN